MSPYPRLATPADIPRLVSGAGVHYSWPPPGTTVVRAGFPEPWVVVIGEPSEGNPGDWWVTDLGEISGLVDSAPEEILLHFATAYGGPVASFAGAAANWPVIYEAESGRAMRWIHSVFRGALGSTEQFQYQINWGNPGNDPDPNESETLAFAQTLRDTWKITASANHPTVLSSYFVATIKWVEVGATVLTQTSGTESDGTGGNLEQKFETQWAPYTVGSEYKGTSGLATSLPYEVSCAVSLQTDKRGASGRGRLFLPPFSTSTMDPGGLYATAIAGTVGGTFGSFFESIKTSTGHWPVVVSRRRIYLNKVTSVNVGLVPDSQRRRRRSQDEGRTTSWTAPSGW